MVFVLFNHLLFKAVAEARSLTFQGVSANCRTSVAGISCASIVSSVNFFIAAAYRHGFKKRLLYYSRGRRRRLWRNISILFKSSFKLAARTILAWWADWLINDGFLFSFQRKQFPECCFRGLIGMCLQVANWRWIWMPAHAKDRHISNPSPFSLLCILRNKPWSNLSSIQIQKTGAMTPPRYGR